MSDLSHEPLLPKVEQADILALVTEEVLDPAHVQWWKQFAKENSTLAREVIKRAYFASIEVSGDGQQASVMEMQKTIVDAVSFALSALRVAAVRLREETEQPPSLKETTIELPNDGAGDADPQPSA